MFDDLRKMDDGQSSFEDTSDADLEPLLNKKKKAKSGGRHKLLLGMTAFQRFVISGLLFLMVCILGMMAVLISSSM